MIMLCLVLFGLLVIALAVCEDGGAFILLVIVAVFMVLACSCVSGCSAIRPDALHVEVEHVSHASQHKPFTSTPTNFGYDVANFDLHWQRGNFYGDLSEGYVFHSTLDNRREVFEGRAGIAIPLK